MHVSLGKKTEGTFHVVIVIVLFYLPRGPITQTTHLLGLEAGTENRWHYHDTTTRQTQQFSPPTCYFLLRFPVG